MKEKVKVYELVDIKKEMHDCIILNGTIKDVRKWAKDQWKTSRDYIRGLMNDLGGNLNEEDFYTKMDDDLVLFAFLEGGGYILIELCEVPLDDFNLDKPSEELVDAVLSEMKKDIASGDLTALDELIRYIPVNYLMGYLPEK